MVAKSSKFTANTLNIKHDFKYVVLQGATTDVTNLNTANIPNGNIKFLKQEVLVASRNMISAARNIIIRNMFDMFLYVL